MPPAKGTHNSPDTEFKKGHKKTESWKLGMSSRMKGKSNPSWKHGKCADKKYLSWIKNRWYYRKKSAEGQHSYQEWLDLKAKYNWQCANCYRKEPDISLTEDHIIPLSKGGSDYIKNIQPLCRSCNCSKRNSITLQE